MLATLFAFTSHEAKAIGVVGNFRLGLYSRTVEFDPAINGDTSNDEQVVSAQLKMDVNDFDSYNDTFVIDMRDKMDSYGKLDSQNLSLQNYNRFQVREMAFKRPWEYNRFYFTLGRFSLTEANIIDNDGVELGYRFSKQSRLGLFGGMAPKDVITPYYVSPTTQSVNNVQGGLYYSYEKRSGVESSLYSNNALAMSPTYDITDKKSHSYFYHMAVWNVNPQHRLSSYLVQDFAPTASMRRASLSHSYTTTKLKTNLSLIQSNSEDYLVQRDLLDPLAPSSEQLVRFDLRHKTFPGLNLDLQAGIGNRSADKKSSSEYALGLIFPKFIAKSGSARVQYGIRNNYYSKDSYVRGGYDFWHESFSASLIHTILQQTYDTGLKNTRQITMIDAGFFLSDRIRGALAYQIEKDDRLSASAFFLMIGYRFGTGAASPIRTRPALFEEI